MMEAASSGTETLGSAVRTKKIDDAKAELVAPASPVWAGSDTSERDSIAEANLEFLFDRFPEIFERVLQSSRQGAPEVFYWKSRLRHHRLENDPEEAALLFFRSPLVILPFTQTICAVDPTFMPKERSAARSIIGFETAVDMVLYPLKARNIIPSDETIEAVSMLVYLNKLHKGNAGHPDYDSLYDNNIEDIAYLVSRLDEVRSIFPELVSRKSCDRALVRELLDSPSLSLTEGIL